MNNKEMEEFEELKEKDLEEETTMEYSLKIKIKKDVEDKIIWLTQNYPEEISAFMTGELKEGEVIIDGLLFPYQDVSTASVEVEPKNLIKLRKEYGDKCLRIIGHWHSHNNMGAFWSSTDDNFIKQYSRTKDFSVFFVSSTKSRCKVMAILNKPFHLKIDNLDYETFWESSEISEELQQVINDKVTEKTLVSYPNGYEDYWSSGTEQTRLMPNPNEYEDTREEEIRNLLRESIEYDGKAKTIKINNLKSYQAEALNRELEEYTPSIEFVGSGENILTIKPRKNDNFANVFQEVKERLSKIYEEELNIEDYSNPNYYWG